jgi:hypothetical protein
MLRRLFGLLLALIAAVLGAVLGRIAADLRRQSESTPISSQSARAT